MHAILHGNRISEKCSDQDMKSVFLFSESRRQVRGGKWFPIFSPVSSRLNPQGSRRHRNLSVNRGPIPRRRARDRVERLFSAGNGNRSGNADDFERSFVFDSRMNAVRDERPFCIPRAMDFASAEDILETD